MSTTDSIPRIRTAVADDPRHLLDETKVGIRRVCGVLPYRGHRRPSPLRTVLRRALSTIRGAL